ncbi:hypothetical protein [Metamycoplasma hominis]|uniref:Uncharacterized protein n=2 Tax=Metamycoplasma hominis TaxID=2098 RepID=D1J7J6_METH1|nr:hypothetical protein [Metamycoplasma hominis]AKJ52335.1 hypothetical protein MHOMSp_00300 [Metamycoplasma hominis]MBD3899162.1 hypothetical protein [Metamycoplasma hominis]MCF1354670.1 hypothetical protein [Metamycoplasma hominis]MDU7418469.1 hypothetical protein [Metamycoplasma hominis]MTH75838.1 hypothetical protein [Metamycoplasma hominis]
MITIDYVFTKDEKRLIVISNASDSKNKYKIEIDLDNPSDAWNKENINNFIIRAISISDEKLSEPQLTESAQEQLQKGNKQIEFIKNLFTNFVERYNEN